MIASEVTKQHRQLFSNKRVYFTFLVWPVTVVATTYFMYQPFQGGAGGASVAFLGDNSSVFMFALTGQLGYTFFYSMTESAWRLAGERYQGTLEIVFLSPVNRLAFLMGQALVFLFQAVWMFTVLYVAIVLWIKVSVGTALVMGAVGILVLTVSAFAWGTFLNSVFLLSRDSGLLYQIFQDPVSVLSGVQVPVQALPSAVRGVAQAIPLTVSLQIIRSGLAGGDLRSAGTSLLILLPVCGLLFLVAWFLTGVGERRARKFGEYGLF